MLLKTAFSLPLTISYQPGSVLTIRRIIAKAPAATNVSAVTDGSGIGNAAIVSGSVTPDRKFGIRSVPVAV